MLGTTSGTPCKDTAGAKILDDYVTHQLLKLQPRATCIQTDAGMEFLLEEWAEKCRKAGLTPRHAPPACQVMNGQVEKDVTRSGDANEPHCV